jgi:hypothetical protein
MSRKDNNLKNVVILNKVSSELAAFVSASVSEISNNLVFKVLVFSFNLRHPIVHWAGYAAV